MDNLNSTPNKTKREEWRDIPGYEGYYQVSSLGNVRSLDRIILSPKLLGGRRRTKGAMMTKTMHSTGYFRVRFCKNHNATSFFVHTLVALAFIGERPPGFDIHHKDDDKCNNTPGNLEYLSRSDHLGGAMHYSTNLTDKDVTEIRRLYAETHLAEEEIAERFNATPSAVHNIVNGASRKHLPITKRIKRYHKGIKNNMAKLTEKQVREIRSLWASGKVKTYTGLAQGYNVTYQTIQNVVSRKTWKHID